MNTSQPLAETFQRVPCGISLSNIGDFSSLIPSQQLPDPYWVTWGHISLPSLSYSQGWTVPPYHYPLDPWPPSSDTTSDVSDDANVGTQSQTASLTLSCDLYAYYADGPTISTPPGNPYYVVVAILTAAFSPGLVLADPSSDNKSLGWFQYALQLGMSLEAQSTLSALQVSLP